MTEPEDYATDNTSAEVSVLRDRIDVLEARADDKDKPWYRKSDSLVAVIALILSVVSFGLGLLQQRAEDNDHKLEQLESLASELIQIQEKSAEYPQNPQNLAQQSLMSALTNADQSVTVAKAMQILKINSQGVPSVKGLPGDLYFTFGAAEYGIGNYSEAIRLLTLVISDNQISRSTTN